MTAEHTEEGEVLAFTTRAPDPTGAVIPFTLDDDPTILRATRPKQAVLVDMYRKMDGLGEQDPALLDVFDTFMDVCFDHDSREHIEARFRDPDDTADIDDLGPIIETLMGRWYRRPTTRPSGSSPPSRRSGPRSTGRRRS